MNPIDMRGPSFLAFYLLASTVGLFILYLVSKGFFTNSPRFPTGEGRRHLRDPYLLAYLRGGVQEALKTVAFSLNKRKLLSSSGAQLIATRSREVLQAVRHPLELAVLSQCAMAMTPSQLVGNHRLGSAVDGYVEPLRETGLITGPAELGRRFPAFIAIAGTLFALGALKIAIALQRGHTNIAFLGVLTLIVLIWAFAIFRRRRTLAGDRALSDQQTLFARLRSRVNRLAADGATDEAVLVAAAYGLDSLPESEYPFAHRLKRQVERNSSNTSCSSCGSSCGGGGCGGGCGGCGS